MNNINILDCTIRDGGYYNNWKFNFKDVKSYLTQIYKTDVNVVEIGFNFFDQKKDYGQFAFSNNHTLKKLPKSKNTSLAIMINANELLKIKYDPKKIKKIFKSKLKYVSIIRIAAHYKDILQIIKYSLVLKKIGFKIFLNLMQINTISDSKLKQILKKINSINCFEVFYFADSFGSLKPKDVKKICITIRKYWHGEIGFHSHDNCGLALKNVIAAKSNGANWIDCTIQGMGRGAGNVKTEDVLKYFFKEKNILKPIKKTKNFFYDLKNKYNWGASEYYKFAAKHNIHPTYIQELKKDDRYNRNEINNLIKHMSTLNAKSYDPNLLEKIYINKNFTGKWNASGWAKNRNILILGQGPSIKDSKERKKLIKFIENYEPIVISININKYVPRKYIDFYAAFNDTRILVDHKKYSRLDKPLIVPSYKLKKIGNKTKFNKILDYGAKIENKNFIAKNKYCILPNNQSFGYALAISAIGRAKKTFIFGFDGFSKGHHLNYEMNLILDHFQKNYKKIPIYSISKTNYMVKKLNI